MANADPITTTTEQWRPIPGWEGLYEVSDHGRVRSLDRTVYSGHGRTRRHKGKILKGGIKPAGYPYVNLSRGGEITVYYVHDLVLTAFVGVRPSKAHVARHLDDVKGNNNVSNLAWGSESDNAFDKVRNGHDHYAKRDACKNGHLFTPDNIARRAQYPGTRYCKACMREEARRRYESRREYKRQWRAKRRAEGKPVT